MTKELTLEDLVTISGLTLRTLRFYMQEGLLRGPDTHGKKARYSQQHVDQLEMIQRLKNLRLPLQEIRQLIHSMTAEEVSQIRQFQDVVHSALQAPVMEVREGTSAAGRGSSALDYIQSLEQDWNNVRTITNSPGNSAQIQRSPAVSASGGRNNPRPPKPSTQETWDKIILEDGVEIHIRQPSGLEDQAKVARLVAYARSLFKDR